jgi:tryptophan 7-halogenase
MADDRIRSIVIVGGGAAGWMAAATLARVLKRNYCEIRLIDLPQPHPGAISESTVSAFHRLNGLLAINEADLMRKTLATFNLGVEFRDWAQLGDRYFQTFGSIGARLETVPFHHYWIKLRQLGDATGIEDFSTATAAAKRGRFAHPLADQRSILSLYSYAYHFHADLLASYLAEYAQAHGVARIAREVIDVQLRGEDGFIDALRLDDGTRVAADFYIDCTGTRGLLLEQALGVGHEDWTQWLPCDRAVAIPCAGAGELPPYSQAIARKSGWQWRVPLQQGLDCGYAFSSRFIGDDEATAALLANLPGRALAEPNLFRFASGRPKKFWIKNCLALTGAAMEPLESRRLHLVQTGITRFLTTFPDRRFSSSDAEEYNRLTTMEHERIRDFLILHYQATTREDSPLWRYCRQMEVPDTLRNKIELFRSSGRVSLFDDEPFGEESWLSLFLGQNIVPQGYDPLVDVLDTEQVRTAFARMQSAIQEGVETLPTHRQFITQYCAAGPARSL